MEQKNDKKPDRINAEGNMIKDSYVTKEELITMISNIEFWGVKRCSLELITSLLYISEEDRFKPLTKNIEID